MLVPPQWQQLSKHKVIEILGEFGDLGTLKVPIPIEEVITSYLGDVHFITRYDLDFPEGVSAFSQKDMNLGWLIVINGKECIERQRFSAAHELGHIVLIRNQPDKVFCSANSKHWDEKLCDTFAGDLLMPESFVRELYVSNPSPSLDDVTRMFKISRPVAEIQLKRLGLPFTKSLVGV